MKVRRFTAKWCGPCKLLAPVIDQLQKEHQEIEFETIDIDENEESALKYNIRSVPTVVFEDNNGSVLETVIGFYPKTTYKKILQNHSN